MFSPSHYGAESPGYIAAQVLQRSMCTKACVKERLSTCHRKCCRCCATVELKRAAAGVPGVFFFFTFNHVPRSVKFEGAWSSNCCPWMVLHSLPFFFFFCVVSACKLPAFVAHNVSTNVQLY